MLTFTLLSLSSLDCARNTMKKQMLRESFSARLNFFQSLFLLQLNYCSAFQLYQKRS